MARPRWTRLDTAAVFVVLAIVVAGLAFNPIRHRLNPVAAMRHRWAEADEPLLARMIDPTAEPMWSDGRGGALPAGYPLRQGGKDANEDRKLFEKKLGLNASRGDRGYTPARNERHPALPSVPPDAWGNPYWLELRWADQWQNVLSSGPDGRIGTPDDLYLFGSWIDGFRGPLVLPLSLVFYVGAFFVAWLYLVGRALALPRAPLPWEVARAVVVVSPLFVVFGCLAINARKALSGWSDAQLTPAWLSVSLTLSAVCAGAILWRRTRATPDS